MFYGREKDKAGGVALQEKPEGKKEVKNIEVNQGNIVELENFGALGVINISDPSLVELENVNGIRLKVGKDAFKKIFLRLLPEDEAERFIGLYKINTNHGQPAEGPGEEPERVGVTEKPPAVPPPPVRGRG